MSYRKERGEREGLLAQLIRPPGSFLVGAKLSLLKKCSDNLIT